MVRANSGYPFTGYTGQVKSTRKKTEKMTVLRQLAMVISRNVNPSKFLGRIK